MHVSKAHFLAEDMATFDAPFFSINPNEAACMDPQHRHLLESVYRALENGARNACKYDSTLLTSIYSWNLHV